ncbi:DUF6274 family protein [Streptomyces cyaneofuscatus]|uniref:DUF6274 family protein n=1 Tax=Streptomyces TaxID=1883 RepID=UPI002E11320B|nr:DUF6274 family protein [Streptomyces cyaneofuscatus]WTF36434.1 DUF6274 family protein [Streptomyces cyaneofuscatus]
MSASTARHETRALLRAHLAAAYGYGHLTRHCPVCHRLLRLAMEPGDDARDDGRDGRRDGDRKAREPGAASEPPHEPQEPRNGAGGPSDPGSATAPLEAVPSEAAPPEGDGDERPVAP